MLQHTQTLCTSVRLPCWTVSPLVVQLDYFISHIATHCNALKHSATASIFHVATMTHSFHALQHTATRCTTLQHLSLSRVHPHCNSCNMLHHAAPTRQSFVSPLVVRHDWFISVMSRHLTCMHDTHMMYPSLWCATHLMSSVWCETLNTYARHTYHVFITVICYTTHVISARSDTWHVYACMHAIRMYASLWCATRLIHQCDIRHLHTWHDLTCFGVFCDTPHLCCECVVWRDSFVHLVCLRAWQDSFKHLGACSAYQRGMHSVHTRPTPKCLPCVLHAYFVRASCLIQTSW